MFNKKYNPDVKKNYNSMDKSREKTKTDKEYRPKNKDYKLIISDENKVIELLNPEDINNPDKIKERFSIKQTNENNDDVDNVFDSQLLERLEEEKTRKQNKKILDKAEKRRLRKEKKKKDRKEKLKKKFQINNIDDDDVELNDFADLKSEFKSNITDDLKDDISTFNEILDSLKDNDLLG
jgi:hypothetical protein